MATAERLIGAAVPTKEDRRFVQGRGKFVDDHKPTGLLHAAFVRSPHAHARIVGLETSKAIALPGVHAVLTAEDLAKVARTTIISLPIPGLRPVELPALATGKVRFAGDPIAIVVADDRYVAEDGADLVAVTYEPLPPVVDPLIASDPGASIVDEQLGTNLILETALGTGDVAAAFGSAAHVFRERYIPQRVTPAPMEGRGCVAEWDSVEARLTLTASNRLPHLWRAALAGVLDLGETQIRVVAPDVGGAFGQKITPAREELAVCAAAMQLGRPVKWIEDRRENLAAASHARGEILDLEIATTDRGEILAMRSHFRNDVGGYCILAASVVPVIAATVLPGPYRLDAFHATVDAVMTNKCPHGAYRGPWAVESLGREALLDHISRELGIDPVELRRRNLLDVKDLPYHTPAGVTLEAISPRECLDQALDAIGYEPFRAEQAQARAEGRLLGLGLCVFVEPTAFGTGYLGLIGIQRGGHEVATVRVEPGGQATILAGTSNHGQSHETTFAQVVAETLGLRLGDVRLVQGDTDAVPFGMGTGNSRAAVIGGGACLLAARTLAAKVKRIAGHLLEVSPDDLDLRDGAVHVRGIPNRSVALSEVARLAYFSPSSLPPGEEGGLVATNYYEPPPVTFANATHAAIVELDTATGDVYIRRFIVAEDCGVVINPLVVDGQVIGGVAQGLGSALYEECVYDEQGQLLTGSFMDYLVPYVTEMPKVELRHVVTPSASLGGFKGAGEGGVLGALPAICNAVNDALAQAGRPAMHPPFTPERVLRALRPLA